MEEFRLNEIEHQNKQLVSKIFNINNSNSVRKLQTDDSSECLQQQILAARICGRIRQVKTVEEENRKILKRL